MSTLESWREPTDRFYRYSRQIMLPAIGLQGQERLSVSRVGLIGCGALGSVIASHLCRAGIGHLRIADDDVPELHNLQRQVLFDEEDVRRRIPKVEAATAHLRSINSQIQLEPWTERLDEGSLPKFAAGLDVLVDGTDNFPTRFMINRFCVHAGMPWVYGGVLATSGMTMTIVPGEGPCLRCMLRELPPKEAVPTADMAGILNTVVATVASVEATEVMKLMVDPGSRSRALLVIDLWDMTFESIPVERDPYCPDCSDESKI